MPPVFAGIGVGVSDFFVSGFFGAPRLAAAGEALAGAAAGVGDGPGGLPAMADGAAGSRLVGAGGAGIRIGTLVSVLASALVVGTTGLPSADEPRAAHSPPPAASSAASPPTTHSEPRRFGALGKRDWPHEFTVG